MLATTQFLPPRQQVIYSHTRRMLDETAQNAATFAMAVAEAYFQLNAPSARHVALHMGSGDALLAAVRANAQTVCRYLNGTLKAFPADLEDAWVLSLPEPYRGDCERELLARRGYMPVRLPEHSSDDTAVGLSQLATEFAQLLEALAPALADGVINHADLPYARRILAESDDLIAAVLTLRRQVTGLLPDGGVA